MHSRKWLKAAVLVSIVVILVALIVPAIRQMREADTRTTSQNNLKSVGLALFNYQDTFRAVPVDGPAEPGSASHSWLFRSLPFLDASPWYNMIDLDFDWDHPRNAPISRHVISCYLNPGIDDMT